MRLAPVRKSLWWLPALLVLGACGKGNSNARGDDDDSGGAPSTATPQATRPLPECPDTKYQTCDIREADCQTWLASIAACMRGSEPLGDLPIAVLSEDDYAQLLLESWADYVPPKYFHTEKARSLLGLAPPSSFAFNPQVDLEGAAKEQSSKIGGEYRAPEKRVVIVDHGRPADDVGTNITLVHEFVHALQDVDYGILAWEDDGLPQTFDHNLAQASVFEGEARFYEYRASYPLGGYDIRRYNVGTGLTEMMRDLAQADIEDTAPYSMARLTFPYGFGALVSFYAWQGDGGPAGIDKLWASPPGTTQALMASVLHTDTPQTSPVDVQEPDVPDLSLFSQDSLGAWGVTLVMSLQGSTWNEANTAALSWRGDQLWVYTDDTNLPTYALWEIELGSETAAQRIDDTLAKASDTARRAFDHGVNGKRVFANASFNDSPLPELTDAANAWLSGK